MFKTRIATFRYSSINPFRFVKNSKLRKLIQGLIPGYSQPNRKEDIKHGTVGKLEKESATSIGAMSTTSRL